MKISTITDSVALNKSVTEQTGKSLYIAAEEQKQAGKPSVEQKSSEAMSYNRSGVTVDISERGMEASKNPEMAVTAKTNSQTTDYSTILVEAKKLVAQNLTDSQIRSQTNISQASLDRIHAAEPEDLSSQA
jgi:hypothetical protein